MEENGNWLDFIMTELGKLFSLVDSPILHLHNAQISISSLLISVLIIIAAFKIAKSVGRIANKALEKRGVDSGIRDSLERFIRYSIVTVGVLFSMDNLGFSTSSLAGLGAVLMVGIGFGLQNITQNFISGIIILIERPVKVGDIIQVGASSGRIVDIRVRSTIIQTRDDISIIIPNSKLISEEVINDSYSGQQIRQHIRVGVAYGTDVDTVKQVLLKAATSQIKILQSPAPMIIFENFGDSSLDFDLRYWSSDLWELDQIASDVRCEIDRLFRKENIQIPFPQRDIHILQK